MWEAIQYVGSPLALVAFIAAVVATILRARLRHRVTLLNTLPEDQRLAFLEASLETYHIKHDNLTRQQKYELMLNVLDGRSTRLRIVAKTLVIIAAIVAVAIVLSVVFQPPNPHDRLTLNQRLDEAWDALAGSANSHVITDFANPDIEKARRAIRDARDIDSHDPGIFVVDAALSYITGSASSAETILREGLRRAPEDFDLQFNLAVVLRSQAKWTEATDAFAKASQLDPASPHPYFGLANLHKAQGDFQQSATAFRKALELAPADAQAHFELGQVLTDLGDVPSATPEFAEAVRLAPKNVLFRFRLGGIYLAEKRLDLARTHFEEVIRLNPDGYPDVYLNLGMILALQNDLEQAEGMLRRATVLDPTSPKAHTNLGNLLYSKGEYTAAAEAHRASVSIEPKGSRYLNLGNALVRSGQVTEALAAYREAVGLDSDLTVAIRDFGKNMAEEGQTVPAIPVLKLAAEMRLDDPYARNYYGVALARNGQFAEAIVEFREALRLNPDFREAQSNLDAAIARQR